VDENGEAVLDENDEQVMVPNEARASWINATALTTALGLGIIAYALGKLLHPAIDRATQERIILGQYATAPANPESQSRPARREQP